MRAKNGDEIDREGTRTSGGTREIPKCTPDSFHLLICLSIPSFFTILISAVNKFKNI